MTTSIQTAVRTELEWIKSHDKYGRPKVQLDRIHISETGQWVGRDRNLAVVVTLPKCYFEEYGKRYLVNVRRPVTSTNPTGIGEVTEFVKRAEALRFAESQI